MRRQVVGRATTCLPRRWPNSKSCFADRVDEADGFDAQDLGKLESDPDSPLQLVASDSLTPNASARLRTSRGATRESAPGRTASSSRARVR